MRVLASIPASLTACNDNAERVLTALSAFALAVGWICAPGAAAVLAMLVLR